MTPVVSEAAPGVGRARADPRTWPWWGQVLALYAVTRAFTAAVYVWVAGFQLANLWTPASPSYWKFVGLMFDGSWYRQIAEHGYPATLPRGADGLVQQNAWAFFPLFPALVRAVMTVTRLPWEVAAPTVATLLGAGAVLVIHRCVVVGTPRAVASWPVLPLATVALVCVFPTSPVLQAGYTESLALLLIAGSLYLVMRRRYGAAAVVVVLLGFARAVALPMAVVIGVHALVRWRDARRGTDVLGVGDWVRVVGLGAVAVLSGFAWPLICGWATGVPNGYLLTQESWRGVRTTTPFFGWTYVPQFWFGKWAALVVVAGFGLTIALLVAPAAWRLGNELHTWAAAYIGYIVAVIEPGSSLARFLLLAFPMGAVTAGLVTRPDRARRLAFWAVLALMVGLQVLWIRTIWLFNPHGDWPP